MQQLIGTKWNLYAQKCFTMNTVPSMNYKLKLQGRRGKYISIPGWGYDIPHSTNAWLNRFLLDWSRIETMSCSSTYYVKWLDILSQKLSQYSNCASQPSRLVAIYLWSRLNLSILTLFHIEVNRRSSSLRSKTARNEHYTLLFAKGCLAWTHSNLGLPPILSTGPHMQPSGAPYHRRSSCTWSMARHCTAATNNCKSSVLD